MRFGTPPRRASDSASGLTAVLGRDIAIDFLKSVLRIAMRGASRRPFAPPRYAMPIEAELARHLDRADSAMLTVVLRQVGLARDIAAAIAGHIADRPRLGSRSARIAHAAQTHRGEGRPDRHGRARARSQRLDADRDHRATGRYRMEDSIDELEQAAFLASLMPAGDRGGCCRPSLLRWQRAALGGTEAAASGIAAAAEISAGTARRCPKTRSLPSDA